MFPDLSQLIEDTQYNAFKNNAVYTGTVTLSGSTAAGANVQTFTVPLTTAPDLIDIVFNGPTDLVFGSDPRPSNGWFKQGSVWVPTNNAGGGNPSGWEIFSNLSGTTLTITAVYVQQFVTAEALTPTTLSYRVVDYSVF